MRPDDLRRLYLGIDPRRDREDALRLLVELGIDVVGAQEGSLLAFDRKAKDLVFLMTAGNPEAERKLIGRRVPLGKGITGLAAVTEQVQIGSPVYRDVHLKRRGRGESTAPECVMAAPMMVGGEMAGVMTAATFERGMTFTVRDGEIFARFAALAGVVVKQLARIEVLEEIGGTARRGARTATDRSTADILRLVRRVAALPAAKRRQTERLLAAALALTQ